MRKVPYIVIVLSVCLLAACGAGRKAAKRHTYIQDTYAGIRAAVNEAEVSILNDTIKVLFPEHLLFQKNSSDINTETYPLMKRFAGALIRYNKTDILINGYTDNTGTEELNNTLSKSRAQNAKNLLVQDGVDSVRMLTWGLGAKNPIADNTSAQGKSRNRRVEFIILYSLRTDN